MHIAIIGAGFAGVSAGRVLTQFGHNVTIFEKAPDVGGVWSSIRRYPGLSTQNNKGTYSLIDVPYPKGFPEWPSGEQVQEYLETYVSTFNLESKLRLSTEVVKADLDESGETPSWTVTSRTTTDVSTDGDERAEQFDYLVVANGIFSQPFLPAYPGREEFEATGGRLCTPSDIHEMSEVQGKDVVVVGYGKSACDIAAFITGSTRSTTVIARHLLWKMPKKLMNKLNYKYLMLTRLGEGLFKYSDPSPAEKLLHGPGKPVRDGMLRSIQGVAVKQLKLNQMKLVPDGDFERIARATVSLTSDGFYEKVSTGSLKVKRETEIVRLFAEDGKPMAELTDGDNVPADVVVAATGWRQGVPFLSDDLESRLTDERGNFELWRFILPHDVPALAFCGYNSSFYSPLSAQIGALWIANHIMGGAIMPPVEERRRIVAERLKWMEERTEGKHARGTNIIPFSLHNVDESLRGMGLQISPLQRMREWLLPASPQDYKFVAEALLRRKAGREG